MPSENAGPDPGEQLFEEFLAETHTAAPTELPELVNRCATAMGIDRIVVYLVDIQQRHLVPLTEGMPSLDVDSTPGGQTYRSLNLRIEESEGRGLTAWLPLIDGAERLGVLGVSAPAIDAVRLRRCRMVAAVLAMAITSKRSYSDSLVRRSRTERMELPAEMLRAFLPPRTIGNADALSTAVLEPAYEVGGDAYDHSLTRTSLHVDIFDSMGHDLAAGLTTAVALAGCRAARRDGGDLLELVDTVDQALARWLPDQYCTGIVTQLDLAGGLFRWCNCGHPSPLLIRGRCVLHGELDRSPQPPMGLRVRFCETLRTIHEAQLEPGDRVLLYTDGVVESRLSDRTEFGLDRFTDSIIRATAAGELAPEALRRLIHSILDASDNRLRDDATLLLVEWRPPHA
ncbi:PP2C family protein-serine/threonine phosphatase [Streptomyces sp. NBC_01716]|uniref:PP2C family protein-serine/threonine phosphatase n=1 Tax=Streptomyces sp. NBC_01716 TaxID=2975917 RepID=UPI002E37A1F6|nr:PP2C family protein-serine/threonine phosphatase [Streptomyces sp. NBC_01716]